jgi:hypothetical protein
MSDAVDYFRSHAVEAARKARRMEHGRMRNKQRIVARVYRLLARAGGIFSRADNSMVLKPAENGKISERV